MQSYGVAAVSIQSHENGARTYAEYLISNGWTAADAEEAVTGAIVAFMTH
jgi:hypothetical protein